MPTTEIELTGKPAFVSAIARGHNVTEAARIADVSTQTGFRYMQDEAIRSEVRDIRRQTMLAVSSRIALACDAAVDALIDVVTTGKSEHARVQAALGLLSTAVEWIEVDRLAEQVEELMRERDGDRAATSDLRSQLRVIVDSAAGDIASDDTS